MRITILVLVLFFSCQTTFAQQIDTGENPPYEWNWTRDGIWTGTAMAANGLGLYFIINKDGISDAELQSIVADEDNISGINRWAAGNSSETAGKISDIPFYLSFAAPLALFFDDEVNDNSGLVLGIFLETMATSGAMYTITAGLVDKSRPYVYAEDYDYDRRVGASGQRSFFSGHTLMTATATFFVAKVYQDFNPGSSKIPYFYAGAALLPAAVGFLRIQAGQHFLTDVLIGYGLGALSGYFIPHLHKKRKHKMSVLPVNGIDFQGKEYTGLSLRYRF
ncbi:phosphatase PAP2 family protein [Hanstruepera ponticola]|uniref:phosphatase PAP2 family protein n=1 Tax=Hanstruepera ponticola TaxID=2042995 RepID=UPI000CF13428|nr:phosphatase PAP2 family protein [Hanstruepera ponticola]